MLGLSGAGLSSDASAQTTEPQQSPAINAAPIKPGTASQTNAAAHKTSSDKTSVAATKAAAKFDAPTAPNTGATLVIITHADKPKLDKAEATKLDQDKCFDIRTITIHGIELVKVDEVRQAVEPLAYHCIGNVLAKSIISAINELHAGKGYVTTQGYVPTQDIKTSHALTINVVTGRIARIVPHEYNSFERFPDAWQRMVTAKGPWGFLSGLSGVAESLGDRLDRFQLISPKAFPTLKAWLAMPAEPGDALNIDTVQQGIDQLNKSPSQQASAKLAPGTAPGTSDVDVDIPRANSFRLAAGYEINGAALNGPGTTTQQLARIDVAKDNLIGLNDNWSGSFASGIDTNEARLSVLVPVRWMTVSAYAGYTETLQAIDDADALYTREWTAGLNGSYLISRDHSQQTTIDTGLTWRNNLRWIDDIELSPQNVSIGRLGITHTRYFDGAQLVTSVGLNQGFRLLGATRDAPDGGFDTPRARFFKLDGSMSYSQAVKSYGTLTLNATGQWTHDTLYQDDQLIFGSTSTVRGFARAPGVADRGIDLRTEFAPQLPVDWLFGAHAKDLAFGYDVLHGVQPYLFADYGYGRDIAEENNVRRASTGVGVRYNLGRIALDWTAARPLSWGGQRIEPLIEEAPKISRFEMYLNLSVKLL